MIVATCGYYATNCFSRRELRNKVVRGVSVSFVVVRSSDTLKQSACLLVWVPKAECTTKRRQRTEYGFFASVNQLGNNLWYLKCVEQKRLLDIFLYLSDYNFLD